VIKACIKLMGASDFQTSVGEVLNIILEASAAHAARILLVDHEKRLVTNFCGRTINDTWANPDVLTYDLVQTWESMIGVSNDVIVQNEQDMVALGERNQIWARSMRENHISSLVLIPLRRGKQVVGYMYVVNYDVEKTVEVKELVELMSFFLGSEIYNHILLQKLEELSQVDVLTGAFNRRAMINRMKEISASRCPYGVISIDLNGLKTVNDNEGHEAGDRLLIQAGELFRKVFYQDDVFRTGGDEFVIICKDMDQETFNRKVQRLNMNVEKNGVACAVGCYWSDGGTDMKTSFRYADEMMYADKKAFYDRYPDLKRR
jgi:diguanylate cyclase (GGDEF)-like protein